MRIIGNILKVIISLAMVVAVVAVAAFIFASTDLGNIFKSGETSASKEPVMFKIQAGDTVDTVADNLQKEGIIDNAFWFKLQVRAKGASSELKAGSFQVTPGMSTDKLISTLTTSPKELGVRFQVIEGMRLGEMADKLQAAGIVSSATFMSFATTPEGVAKFQDGFLAVSGKPPEVTLEGYLFPDTYEIKQSGADNSETVIKTMLASMEEKFTPEMLQTIKDRGLTVHQVLTIASIIQREGQKQEELPIISSVFWNRVKEGMRLDADPTTQYAVAKPGNWWPNLDKEGITPGEVDNPYNTYHIQGLPPGPICSPSLLAIQAAVNPEQTEYLYFVAKNDPSDPGAHAFAKTLEEHERNRVTYGNR